ncbi:MAG: hypothetical protein OR997_02465 [Methylophilaceae bacterium]|nr:hypothetical protein [Methylophilaceae bacterium]
MWLVKNKASVKLAFYLVLLIATVTFTSPGLEVKFNFTFALLIDLLDGATNGK